MAAFERTRPGPVWAMPDFVPTRADWEDLDRKQFAGVNGDRGGTWNPRDEVVFQQNLEVTGPTKVSGDGRLIVAATGALRLAADFPRIAPGHALRTRRLVQPLIETNTVDRGLWGADTRLLALRSVAIGIQPSDRSRIIAPGRIRAPLRVQDGATLAAITLTFRVPELREQPPVRPPRFRVVRVDEDGTVQPLSSAADGWVSPPLVPSAAAWFAGGQAQTVTYVCDQHHVIDVGSFTYWAEIEEEGVSDRPVPLPLLDGQVLRERKLDVDLATTAPTAGALSGSITIDGTATTAGMRVLVKNGISGSASNRYANGIWVASAGAWTRSLLLDDLVKFTPNFFLRVRGGDFNAGSVWQLAAPYPSVLSGTSSNGGAADIHFEPMRPLGNAYHSVVLDFTNIERLRWQ